MIQRLSLVLAILLYSSEIVNAQVRIPYSRVQIDSIREVHKQFNIDMVRIRIADLETNDQKDTLLSLSIGGANLTEVPEFLKECKNLKSLRLGNNNFESYPDFLGELTSLTYLSFSGNEINEIPQFVFNLHNLENINLSVSNIKKIPVELNNLKKLK